MSHKFWVQAHIPPHHHHHHLQYLTLRHKQQRRIFQRAQTLWIIMCVLKLRTMSCQNINVISCICYALHSNDSHNTQPSEHYYNYLSFHFSIFRCWKESDWKLHFPFGFFVGFFVGFFLLFGGDLPSTICSMSSLWPMQTLYVTHEPDTASSTQPTVGIFVQIVKTPSQNAW